jgi:hypothetical protein
MASKLDEAVKQCITRLNGDAAMNSLGWSDNNVYWYHPPKGTSYPCIVLQKQTDGKTYHMKGLAFRRHWVVFKVVDGGEATNGMDGGVRARALAERVEDLLNGFRPSIPSGYVMQIETDSGFEYPEAEVGNKFWYHVGSTFTFWIGE